MVVLGTAGSGKSLMAIHRAARLADPETSGVGPTLLVTFTKALVAYLTRWAAGALGPVSVKNFSQWARDTAVAGDLLSGWTRFAQYEEREALVRAAVGRVQSRLGEQAVLARDIKFFVDEFDWIAGMGCDSEQEYQAAERVGRGGGVNRGEPRSAVWGAYQEYRQLLADSDYDEDWPGLTNLALEALRSGATTSSYRHVIVDEAQDLSPQALRALAALVPDNGSLTLFADYAQQMYGGRLSWTQVGIERPTIERFAENYRNSTAIANLAIAMSDQGYFRDTEDLVTPTAPVSPGEKPVLVDCAAADEREFVVDRARAFASSQRVGVIVKSRDEIRIYCRRLGSIAAEFHGDSTDWHDEPGVTVTTYHSAKGVEFDTVIMPGVTSDEFPDPDSVDVFGEQEARSRAARLLYVGITRAKSNLLLTHDGELTSLLPPDTPDLVRMQTA